MEQHQIIDCIIRLLKGKGSMPYLELFNHHFKANGITEDVFEQKIIELKTKGFVGYSGNYFDLKEVVFTETGRNLMNIHKSYNNYLKSLEPSGYDRLINWLKNKWLYIVIVGGMSVFGVVTGLKSDMFKLLRFWPLSSRQTTNDSIKVIIAPKPQTIKNVDSSKNFKSTINNNDNLDINAHKSHHEMIRYTDIINRLLVDRAYSKVVIYYDSLKLFDESYSVFPELIYSFDQIGDSAKAINLVEQIHQHLGKAYLSHIFTVEKVREGLEKYSVYFQGAGLKKSTEDIIHEMSLIIPRLE